MPSALERSSGLTNFRLRRIIMKALFAVTLCLGLVACSSDDGANTPGNDLFGAPPSSKVTENKLEGTWGGSQVDADGELDYRMRFTGSTATLANRCKFKDGTPDIVVGIDVPVRITADKITFLENKSDTKKSADNKKECGVRAQIKDYAYELAGTKLTLKDGPVETELTKISD
jgi:hypothetical protein